MSAIHLAMVVFAGVVGPQSAHVDHQLGSLLHHDAHIESVELSPKDQRLLVEHGAGVPRVIRALHTDGVVVGEVIAGRRSKRLRVLVYDGEGRVVSEVEVPLEGESLTRSGISLLREAVVADALALAEGEPGAAPVSTEDDTDDAPAVDPPATSDASDTPGDSPSGPADTDTAAEIATTVDSAPPLHMGAAIGIGFFSRAFTPDSPAIPGYDAPAVGAVRFQGDIEPTRRFRLDFLAERSLGMITVLDHQDADTEVTRWQADLSYTVLDGRISLAPGLGVGRRCFGIESKSPARSPDGDYLYVVAGLRAWTPLGRHATLSATARVEPVVGGAQPTETAFGEAARVGVDLGLGVDVEPWSWLLVRAEVGYQRFAWTFSAQGGAVDRYAGAALSLGTRY
jgi:hypothetical protein